MALNYIVKKIKDRNGNEKSIRVAVKENKNISIVPKWRGLEYGWGEEDITPENNATSRRQDIQVWAINHKAKIVARNVKIDNIYVPLIYKKGENLFIVQFDNVRFPEDYSFWFSVSKMKPRKIFNHRVFTTRGVRAHKFSIMSEHVGSINS